jgi:metal-sulfur cluster biosynthetic enzyme
MPTKDEIMEQLRTVIDPEIGIDIVSLGLIYEIDVTEDEVKIKMTMTTPACPLSGLLVSDVESVLRNMGYKKYDVQLVFDPPWTPDMMDEKVRNAMGL